MKYSNAGSSTPASRTAHPTIQSDARRSPPGQDPVPRQAEAQPVVLGTGEVPVGVNCDREQEADGRSSDDAGHAGYRT
jgi:hypothetical protein